MLDSVINRLVESIDSGETEFKDNTTLIDEEIDDLLDEACGRKKKVDPAEKEHPLDESILIGIRNKEIKEFDIKKSLKEGIESGLIKEIDKKSLIKLKDRLSGLTRDEFANKMVDEPMELSENIEIAKAIIGLDEDETALDYELIDSGNIFNETPSSATIKDFAKSKTVWKYDKEVAKINLKMCLERHNDKMRRKGYLPLAQVNDALKAVIASINDAVKTKIIKLNGVICLSHTIGNKLYKNFGCCYYNNETNKIRVYEFTACVKEKTLGEDIENLLDDIFSDDDNKI